MVGIAPKGFVEKWGRAEGAERWMAQMLVPRHSHDYKWLDEIIADCPEHGQLVRLVRSGQVDGLTGQV